MSEESKEGPGAETNQEVYTTTQGVGNVQKPGQLRKKVKSS